MSLVVQNESGFDGLSDSSRSPDSSHPRPYVAGKFFFIDGKKFFVKGVSYGPFGPEGREFCDHINTRRDFVSIRKAGCNTLRTYTVPPSWVLDLAHQNDLRILVGIPWEQHLTASLEKAAKRREIERQVCAQIEVCRGHPAIFAYVLGNEIPGTLVRWHGPKQVERFLRRITHLARKVDSRALFTYANYPTTEYLDLPFLDFLSFNLFLEDRRKLSNYLQHLQTQGEEYLGYYPGGSEEAVTRLKDLQRRGADFILFPETSRWWLDYYGGFRAYLEGQAEIWIDEPGVLVAFHLLTPEGTDPGPRP